MAKFEDEKEPLRFCGRHSFFCSRAAVRRALPDYAGAETRVPGGRLPGRHRERGGGVEDEDEDEKEGRGTDKPTLRASAPLREICHHLL